MIDPMRASERPSFTSGCCASARDDGPRRFEGAAVTRPGQRLGCRLAAGLLAGALSLSSLPAVAVEVGGFRFDDSISIGGTDLRLNGVGLRSVFILKAFLAALYVPQRTGDAGELIRQTGPRRLQLRMLVDMSPDRLLKTFTAGLPENLGELSNQTIRPQIEQLNAALHSVGTVRKGDTLDLDVVDGQMRLQVNGQARGVVPGEEVFAAILRGWVGERPLEKDLKKGLLGG